MFQIYFKSFISSKNKQDKEWIVSYILELELNDGLEKEKETRIKNEKDNMGKINESLFVIKEQLKEERD